jgi:hypothetical protein
LEDVFESKNGKCVGDRRPMMDSYKKLFFILMACMLVIPLTPPGVLPKKAGASPHPIDGSQLHAQADWWATVQENIPSRNIISPGKIRLTYPMWPQHTRLQTESKISVAILPLRVQLLFLGFGMVRMKTLHGAGRCNWLPGGEEGFCNRYYQPQSMFRIT